MIGETRPAAGSTGPLADGFGRIHDDLRISVTDRCNLRCSYCMPIEPQWFDRDDLLTYEEIHRLVKCAVDRGVRRLRITGGEPLVRRQLPRLIATLADIPGLEDLALTTNGILLGRFAPDLAAAGLSRINVSLDTVDRALYERLTRRDTLRRVLEGLEQASACGLGPIKINTVLMRGVNDHEVEDLVERGRDHGWEVRFIEFMPLENGRIWNPSRVVSGEEVRTRIARRWPLDPDPSRDPCAPATRYLFRDGRGAVGFINSVTDPFCGSCSRLRITSDGKFRVCLYDAHEVDLRTPLRSGGTHDEIGEMMAVALRAKGRGGAIDLLENGSVRTSDRTMHQIGG